MKKRGNLLQGLLLALLSAFIFWLMISFQLWLLVWIFLIPLIYVMFKEKSWLIILFITLTAFLIAVGSFSWLSRYNINFLWLAIFMISLFGFLIGLSFFLIKKIIKKKFTQILFFPVFWSFLLIVFSFHWTGNTWFQFSYYQPTAPLIWFIGASGVTFLIILTNSVLANYFLYKNKKILVIAILLLLIPVSSIMFNSTFEFQGDPIKVALIQGNIDKIWLWRFRNPELILDTYERLTMEAAASNPDFIIWPEYSIPNDLFLRKDLYDRVSNIAKQTNSYLIIGTLIFIDKEKNSESDDFIDAALVFSPEGELIGQYESPSPVSANDNVIPGSNQYVIETDKGKISTGLCFEEYIDSEIFSENSDFIIIMTNNQRFDNSRGIPLIAQFSKLRAAENKKYVLRATNTGITQVINPSGKVIGKLEPYKEGILISEIYIYLLNSLKTTTTLCPKNPNEFDIA